MEDRSKRTDLTPLVDLAHRRWSIPVIAELHRRRGAKFVTLVNALGVSRASLSTALNDLIELGFVARNTGHGHPMRPEYLLTAAGAAIGDHCAALVAAVRQRDESDLAFRKWTLPLVAAIGDDVRRFGEIRAALALATPRAVTLGLKSLLQSRWVDRRVIDAYPPAAAYALLPRGRRILTCVHGLY